MCWQKNCTNEEKIAMKKLLIIPVCLFAFACNNPEDNANQQTDSAGKNYNEGNTLNSNPGPTDNDGKEGMGQDTSRFPHDSMQGNRPINGADTSKRK